MRKRVCCAVDDRSQEAEDSLRPSSKLSAVMIAMFAGKSSMRCDHRESGASKVQAVSLFTEPKAILAQITQAQRARFSSDTNGHLPFLHRTLAQNVLASSTSAAP